MEGDHWCFRANPPRTGIRYVAVSPVVDRVSLGAVNVPQIRL